MLGGCMLDQVLKICVVRSMTLGILGVLIACVCLLLDLEYDCKKNPIYCSRTLYSKQKI